MYIYIEFIVPWQLSSHPIYNQVSTSKCTSSFIRCSVTMRCTISFAVTVFVLIKVSTGNIMLVNNGYENVNIFITDHVKEDPKLIDNIKVNI